MPLATWITFLFVSLAATFSPGPGVLLAISTSVTLGARRTLYSSAGNALGVFIVATVAITGLGLLLQTSTMAFSVLKIIGAGYLIYLGVRQWRSKAAAAQPKTTTAIASTRSKVFLHGLLVALTNPKAILFFTAIFPQFIQTSHPDPVRFLLLTSTFVVCVVTSHLFYITLATRMGSSIIGTNGMMGTTRMRYLNRASGLIFIGLGCAVLTITSH
ncbi:LysE family translocator [Solimicrobium silvestre]|uniref:Putative threonine efflux protein n=1 Tax=Solimicrobium silvestre TaxID=2099400 RepID=A0A2S9GVU1_9BURK|nr:LysE family translocator [Solimicrobium silvestre]PRC91818.1 putative threonine efflux protein [Solimicrobium silvestre]